MQLHEILSNEYLHINIPLYEKIELENDESCSKQLYTLFYSGYSVDCFCIECNRDSTFVKNETYPTYDNRYQFSADNYSKFKNNFGGIEYFDSLLFNLTLKCSRDSSHQLYFNYRVRNGCLTKIGQFPSMADLSKSEIRKYKSVLSNDKFIEFSKAIGLTSHGIGIGSFVYLRRIFEDLIEEAHIKTQVTENWLEDNYQRARMDDKIQMVKDFLPDFLVRKRVIYSILSKGIHELAENECLEIFPLMKIGIEVILDEKLAAKEREEKMKLAETAIDKVAGNLKSQLRNSDKDNDAIILHS